MPKHPNMGSRSIRSCSCFDSGGNNHDSSDFSMFKASKLSKKIDGTPSALSGPSTSEESSLHHNLIALLKPATIRCVGANGGP